MTLTETRRLTLMHTDKMRATVFHGPGDIRVERSRSRHAGVGEAVIRVTTTTICGTDVHIVKGEYPVRPGLVIGHEPVGVIEELGPGVDRLRGRRARARRRDHAVRPVPRLPVRQPQPVRPRRRLRGHRRLALRQHDRRRPGRVSARPVRPGEPRADPGRPDRRAGRAAGRHRLDRLQRRRVGRRADRRRGRRLRAGPDRPVRDGRREADGRLARHRRRQRPGAPRDGQAHGRRRRRSTSPRSTSSPRSSG